MADQGIATFSGMAAVVLSCDGTLSRGVRPSVFRLKIIPPVAFDRPNGTLTLTYPGTTITLPNCAVVGKHFRPFYGRDKYRWVVALQDRRWKWRYPRIDGVYNERAPNGTIQTGNKKNIKQLMELCLVALGETGYTTSAVPADVYPPVVWNRARADLELQWLCDLVGMVVCYKVSTDKVTIQKLNDTSGAAMPAGGVSVTPQQSFKPAVAPDTLRIQGDPTIIQAKLPLEPVGLEDDGRILAIANLSYKPAAGWEEQWHNHFADVAIGMRHYAFQTVWRWFRPKAPTTGWEGDGTTIDDYSQIELLPYMAESDIDPDGVYRRLPPVVTGSFWPQCDHAINTSNTTVYAGTFAVRPELGVVEFEYPVVKIAAGAIAEPELYLWTAYRVRKTDSDGYAVYTKDKAVTKGSIDTEPRVLPHPELTKVKIIDAWYGDGAADNLAGIDAEAESYLDMVEATYDFAAADERFYNGLVKHDLDGAIAQVRWKCGGGPALTRIGRMTEFDIYSQHQQQRRAMERLAQMAERQSL